MIDVIVTGIGFISSLLVAHKIMGYFTTNGALCVSHLVASDSLQPCGLQYARLLCPWNSPGKDTGVGCHSLLQRIFSTLGLNPGLLLVERFFTIWATREPQNLLNSRIFGVCFLRTSLQTISPFCSTPHIAYWTWHPQTLSVMWSFPPFSHSMLFKSEGKHP